MDANSIYASFGFIDIIVMCVGVYGFYSWYLLVKKQEIKKTLLIGGNSTPEQCTDVEGFGAFMGKRLLILSAAMVIYGGISAYNSYVASVGILLWIGMAIFIGIIVWYCYYLRKADALYFQTGKKDGRSIKEKALKR